MNFMFNRRIFGLALVAASLTGCASVQTPVSIAETIAQEPSLSTFNGLIAQAGLSATLQGPGPFTVFAPNNDAFKSLPQKTMNDITKDPASIKNVLTFHVIPGALMSSQVKNSSVKALNDAHVSLSKAGDFVTIEQAMVQQSDIQASNGVIHVIDSVLIPPHKK
jgi:uncharacterized surface protein with fasciclin (FAS1) repeats